MGMKARIMDFYRMSTPAILAELGQRLRSHRLNLNLTQAEVATRAGIGRRTLVKAEAGGVTTLETLVSILRGLGRLEQLDAFLPTPPLSPVQLAQNEGRVRQRASSPAEPDAKAGDAWEWGE